MSENTKNELFYDLKEVSEGVVRKRCILCHKYINVGQSSQINNSHLKVYLYVYSLGSFNNHS